MEPPIWLNATFFQKILRSSENDETIKVTHSTSKPAVGKGDNYGSNMIRTGVEYFRDNKSDTKKIEKKSVIVKISLVPQGFHDEFTETMFATEIRMMETILCEMNKMLGGIDRGYRLSARSLYTQQGDLSLIAMEDLAPLGYRMADRRLGLDLEHSIIAIRGIAKFHASSVALCEKDPTAMNTYGKGMYHENHPAGWKMFFSNALTVLGNEILNWSELGSSAKIYSEKILKLSEVCYEKTVECLRVNPDRFSVINHGDFWVNNILFKYNDEGRPIDQIFVDFQLSMWNTPALDIGNFFNTSLAADVELHHCDDLLEEYLNTLTKTMRELGCRTVPPSMADLETSLVDHEFYGVMSSFALLPLVLIDTSDVMTFGEMMEQKGGYKNPAYSALDYRKILMRRLATWDAHGSLD